MDDVRYAEHSELVYNPLGASKVLQLTRRLSSAGTCVRVHAVAQLVKPLIEQHLDGTPKGCVSCSSI